MMKLDNSVNRVNDSVISKKVGTSDLGGPPAVIDC